MFNLDNLIVRGVENFELLKRAVLEAVEVLQLVARNIEEFEIWHTIQASSCATIVRTMLHKERLDPVVTQLKNLELRQVTKATQRAHLVVGQVELTQIWALTLIKHVLKVSQLAS